MEDKHTKKKALVSSSTLIVTEEAQVLANCSPFGVPEIDLPLIECAANAKLFTAAFNSFDSAASRLGISAIQLAESLQHGGIAELVQFSIDVSNGKDGTYNESLHAILAKIRKEGE